MADAILIACPECNKKLRTPSRLQGKKIRCKACGHTFTAQAGAAGQESDAVGKAPKTKAGKQADLHADFNPYAVTETDLSPRCPHCAAEMESADAIICLHCGYNTRTRERHQTKAVYYTTGMDYFIWLLPGIVCAIVVLGLIGFIVFLVLGLKDLVEANKDAWWVFGLKAMQVWGTVFALFAMFFAGKFAIRRLIFHPKPPERTRGGEVAEED